MLDPANGVLRKAFAQPEVEATRDAAEHRPCDLGAGRAWMLKLMCKGLHDACGSVEHDS